MKRLFAALLALVLPLAASAQTIPADRVAFPDGTRLPAKLDLAVQGLTTKTIVKVATTGAITASGLPVIDGVQTVAGDRVLRKNETSQALNGIYVAASGAWVRATDLDAWSEVPGAFVFVSQGTTQAATGWTTTAAATGTIGTTAMPWAQFSGAGTYTASGGVALTGNVFSLAPVAASTLRGNATGATAVPIDLPVSSVRSLLAIDQVSNTSDAAKPLSTAETTALAGKEPSIAAGTTGQYWRGDKSWQALATVATTGAYASLSGTPALSTVATTGAYADLSGKPTLGTMASQNASAVTISGGTIAGVVDLAVADGGTGASTASVALGNLGGAPLASPTFTGTATLPRADVSDLNLVGSTLTIASDAITVTGSAHTLIGEGATTDDLVTINGGVDGQILLLRTSQGTGIPITIRSTGNIRLAGGDLALASSAGLPPRQLLLRYTASDSLWTEVARTRRSLPVIYATDANATFNALSSEPEIVLTGPWTAARNITLLASGFVDNDIRTITNLTTGGFGAVIKSLSNAGTTAATLASNTGARFIYLGGNWSLLPGI